MLAELGVGLAFYVLPWVYHRIVGDDPKSPRDPIPPAQIPRTEQGTGVPLVFGRCRVRQPMLVWTGQLQTRDIEDDTRGYHRVYAIDMLFSAGIGMGSGGLRADDTNSNKLYAVWWGDQKLPKPSSFSSVGLPFVSGINTFYGKNVFRAYFGGTAQGGWLRGAYYWHGGWSNQSLTSPPSRIGDQWAADLGDATLVPGIAQQMLVSFVRLSDLSEADPYTNQTLPDASVSTSEAFPSNGIVIGESPSVSSVSFEVSSYGDAVSGVTNHIFAMSHPGVDFGGDADPAECIYDLITNPYGKLGLPTTLIDLTSFGAVSTTLKSEGNGYSRCVDSIRPAKDTIDEILRQIDGVLRFNRATRKIELKLIRPDYDPTKLFVLDKSNCERLAPGAMSGWSNQVNKVRIVYSNRENDYEDDSEAAQNPADTADGVIEEVLEYPGVTRSALAQAIAERELAWRSRPLMKFTAYVDRSFLRVGVGDPLLVQWTDPDISSIVFRVAAVNHGTLADSQIILTLVQDAFYVFRMQPPRAIGIGLIGDPFHH